MHRVGTKLGTVEFKSESIIWNDWFHRPETGRIVLRNGV
jgi:hypothetical protein